MDITSIANIVKLIAEVGFLIVAAALFLVISLKSYKKQQEWMEKMMDEKLSSVSKDHPASEDVVVLEIINDKIYQELRGILSSLKSDRAYVYLYHNGGVSTSGLFFQRMSCICEVVSQGILPLANSYQGIYRASYTTLCDALKSNNKYLVPDCNLLKGHDDFMYQEFIRRHASAAYFRALKDSQGNVIGFIGIDYCSFNEEISDEKIMKLMKSVALKVSSLVDVRDEVKEEKS